MIKYNNSTINDWYFYTSDIIKVYRNNAVCYYKIAVSGGTPTPPTPSEQYLTLETDSGYAGTFTLRKYTAKSISYSIDDGQTWTTTTATGETVTASKVLLKSSDTTAWSTSGDRAGISCNVNFHVYGNIMSTVYGDDFVGKLTIPTEHQFRSMFGFSTNLTSAENMVLPATGGTAYCYHSLFLNCTNVVSIPDINLASAYTECLSVFVGACSSLTSITINNITDFTSTDTYGFAWGLCRNNTSLKEAYFPSAVKWTNRAFGEWFQNCTALEKIVCPATENTNWYYQGTASSNTTFYKSPNATWTNIPSSWTVVNIT